jgi:hypothetical protein
MRDGTEGVFAIRKDQVKRTSATSKRDHKHAPVEKRGNGGRIKRRLKSLFLKREGWGDNREGRKDPIYFSPTDTRSVGATDAEQGKVRAGIRKDKDKDKDAQRR